jgi:hypothetical protein
MKNLVIAAVLAAIAAPVALSTPASAHRVCNEWGQCWWHPDWDWGDEGWRWRGEHGEGHEGHEGWGGGEHHGGHEGGHGGHGGHHH